MSDLAIAISVYDKFRDVKIICDLLRRNWQGRFDIVVCSSHPDAASHLADCDIDELLATDSIQLGGRDISDPRVAPRARLWARVIDSIRKACGRCADRAQAPYTLHLHADAIPLSWPKLQELLGAMKRHGKRFAARGEGFGFYSWNEPVGAFDDMFFVVDNDFARGSGLWDLNPFDLLPHKISIHGALAILGLTRIGVQRFYHYGSHAESVYWDGKPVVQYPLNPAHPMYFDPIHAFLHIHESGFQGDLGIRLKAHYLRHHGVTKGRHVEEFLAEWETPEAELFARLAESERGLRRFFLTKGIHPVDHGRNFDVMQKVQRDFGQLSLAGKAKWLARMHKEQLKTIVMARLVRKRLAGGRLYRDRYQDTVWPDRLDDLYGAVFESVPSAVAGLS